PTPRPPTIQEARRSRRAPPHSKEADMAGNPQNAALWADADVYVAFLADVASPTVPADADTAFGVDWDLIGLLDGDAGFVESREKDETDHFAWGGILVKTGRRNYKEQHTFTALEWN